jgi:murein DD-endopeptidase MepM/ murein hydrolase activator NlpD
VKTTPSHPVPASHPKPVAATHPVSTARPAPKAPVPAPPAAAPGHYANPLAGANLTPQRVDQGVDYSGSGTLGAVGNGTVTYVGTSGTGWPGAFIEYKLTDGADAGRYVYYAESISPAAGLHVGQTVRAGQPIASIHGGIEIGWASGVGTQPAAQADGQWSGGDDEDNHATADGKSFSALIAQLGGPPGKVEG